MSAVDPELAARRAGRLRRTGAALALAASLASLGSAAPGAVAAPTRYSLANGCYTLQGPGGQGLAGAGPLRMQATALGSYLLYRSDRTFLAAQTDGSVGPATAPSPAADWELQDAPGQTFTLAPKSAPDRVLGVAADGTGRLVAAGAAGDGTRLSFAAAGGCAVYPEAELDASGTPSRGDTPYGRVGGLIEGHMHWMTYEYLGGNFHCGKPWDPYGIPYALPDCSSIEGPQGSAAPVQNFLNYGRPVAPHDTSGYPKMTAWGPDNVTYEGTYWRWIQRAWMGGLRLMVMSINENRVLCALMTNRKTNCDEMGTVRRGFADIRQLQSYVDAQAGGPGKGFFQIVTDPYQARRVINAGKMAVVLEIEVSEPFGCRGWDQPTCNQADVDRGLDEMYKLGVRSSLLLNKFDNPLTGVRFDSGPVGVLINAGNRESAGSFFSARTCTTPEHDNELETGFPQGSAFLSTLLGTLGVQSGTLPAYPPAPHCNTRGLTALGKHVVSRMMDMHMIVNPDHMSQAGVDDTLTLLEARHYSGVISPHGWMDPGNWPRIWKLGGMAFPGHTQAAGYVNQWQKYRPRRTPYLLGWGYGADLGGLSDQPAPAVAGGIAYPFKSIDGSVTFDRQRTGSRTFDYNKDGVDHYGLYADWFADLRRLGGQALAQDMWNGAEAYLEMWERADGIAAPGCSQGMRRLTAHGLGSIALGADWVSLLHAAGQPQQRDRAWSWCVAGARNAGAADVAVLDAAGTVQLAGSTARGRRANGITVGAAARRIGGRARRVGAAIRVLARGRVEFVFAVGHGRVRAVAVATRALARNHAALKAAVARLLAAQTSQAAPAFVPSDAQARAALRGAPGGQTLAGSLDPNLNTTLALLCHLGVQ